MLPYGLLVLCDLSLFLALRKLKKYCFDTKMIFDFLINYDKTRDQSLRISGICGHKNGKFWSKKWWLVAKQTWLLNSMTNNSENCQEGLKVVISDRWSLSLSGL